MAKTWYGHDFEATLIITAIVALAAWLMSAEGPLGKSLRKALNADQFGEPTLMQQLAPALATGALSALGFFLFTELVSDGASYYTMDKYPTST